MMQGEGSIIHHRSHGGLVFHLELSILEPEFADILSGEWGYILYASKYGNSNRRSMGEGTRNSMSWQHVGKALGERVIVAVP